MSYDQVLGHIGEFGPWQLYIFVLSGLAAAGEALITYCYTFVGYVPVYRCMVPNCDVDRR